MSTLEQQKLVSEALELDALGQWEEAYRKYHGSLQILLPLLPTLTPLEECPVSMTQKDQTLGYFQILRNCCERMEAIYATYQQEQLAATSLDPTCSEEAQDYLQFAATTRKPASPQPSDPPTPTPIPESISLPPLTVLRAAKPPKPPASPTRTLLSLSALRKHHESELVAKQLEKSHRILQVAQSGATLLVADEEYVSRLLQGRQVLQNKLNEKILSMFQGITAKAVGLRNTFEMEKRRKSIRTMLDQAQQRGREIDIIEPLMELFTSKTDPLAILLRQLISRSRGLLQVATTQDEHGVSTTLDKVLDEIGITEYHLIEVLQDQYEELQDEKLVLALKFTVQQYIFSSALLPALFSQIRRRCGEDDQKIIKCFINSGWEDLFNKLKVRGKLQLPRDRALDAFPISDSGIYGRAVEEFRLVSIEATPGAKLTALTRGCTAICQAVEDFRREGASPLQSGPEAPEGSSGGGGGGSMIGSEDLILLVAYCLVRAQIPDLASQLLFISRLVPEEMIRGEAGYVLATVQTSLDYALSQFGGSA